MPIDRRIARTRQLLHQSLLDLTIERGYAIVTVQDVLDRAQVARSTFYAHFRDKDDLLLSGFRDLGDYLPRMMFAPDAQGRAQFGAALFRHVGARPALAKAFLGSDAGPLVFGHIRNLVTVAAREWLANDKSIDTATMPSEVLVHHLAGSLMNLLVWWIDHDFPAPADEMGAMAQRLVTLGFAAHESPAV
jgi:AcrR family transcriptional regulator